MTVVDQAQPGTAGVLAPPPLIYAGPLASGLLLQRWHGIRLLPARLAAPVGLALLLLGLIGLPAVLAFRRARTSPKPWKPTTALVTTGAYGLTRNPMYLGLLLLYVGVAWWFGLVWPLLLMPVSCW